MGRAIAHASQTTPRKQGEDAARTAAERAYRVAYAGPGAPAPAVRGKFGQLEIGLLQHDAGEIEQSTTAGGSMDIYVSTTAAQKTVETAWMLANNLGLSVNTTVKIERRGMEG